MLYQSFSGDAESGIARLKAENNTLTTYSTGAFIYVNNTTAEVDLSNNAISMPNTTTLVKARLTLVGVMLAKTAVISHFVQLTKH